MAHFLTSLSLLLCLSPYFCLFSSLLCSFFLFLCLSHICISYLHWVNPIFMASLPIFFDLYFLLFFLSIVLNFSSILLSISCNTTLSFFRYSGLSLILPRNSSSVHNFPSKLFRTLLSSPFLSIVRASSFDITFLSIRLSLSFNMTLFFPAI